MKIKCFICGKEVSTDLPNDTIFRATAECPECIDQNNPNPPKEDLLPEEVQGINLYAWIGKDEHGSNEVGIKQALAPAGIVPLVATAKPKVAQFQAALQTQANRYKKTIRLIRYVPVAIELTLEPE